MIGLVIEKGTFKFKFIINLGFFDKKRERKEAQMFLSALKKGIDKDEIEG